MAIDKKYILDQLGAEKKLRRMALEIVENNYGAREIILAGIKEKGFVVARCIRDILQEISAFRLTLIDITLDKQNPAEVLLSETPEMNEKIVIIVDDVVNSGKTLTYAMKPFLDHQPKKLQILILVERTHTNFPVRPDYVGQSIATTLQEQIIVEIEGSTVTGAYLK
jgi:pyrimidine operon attenuation protein / uracil phosphoribosyltransferase